MSKINARLRNTAKCPQLIGFRNVVPRIVDVSFY